MLSHNRTGNRTRPFNHLKAVQPGQGFFLVFPTDQILYFIIAGKQCLRIFDELLLYFPFASQVQLEIGHGGLDVFMTQAVFNVSKRIAGSEHVHGAGMPETVGGMKGFDSIRRQGQLEIFFAQPINPMPGKFLAALVDEQASEPGFGLMRYMAIYFWRS